MAAKKFTKAGLRAGQAKIKLDTAKGVLDKKNKEIAALKKYIAKANFESAGVDPRTDKPSVDAIVAKGAAKRGKAKLREAKIVKGKVSQAVTDRSRSATRTAGIAKRVAKKGK